MKKQKKYVLLLGGLMWAGVAAAQSQRDDSLAVFRPLAEIARLYQRSAVQLELHLRQEARPITSASDTLEADMEVYYGRPDEYLRAEGLEEIVNDSVVLLVNTPARRILRFRNTPEVQRSLDRSAFLWTPDSSLADMSKRYRAVITDMGEGKNKLTLTSREAVYGSRLPRETIEVIYRVSGSEPVQCTQTRVSLVPVDSSVYDGLQKKEEYTGKLLTIAGQRGRMFFIVKELTTVCYFRKIDRTVKRPPVREGDRVVLTSEGGYKPAQGFEDYLLTQEN